MALPEVIAVAAAGAAGTLSRYSLDQWLHRRYPRASTGPILLINITGSLMLGFLAGLVLFHDAPAELRTIAGTGFCASYTTFSTAMFETTTLLRERGWTAASRHAIGTLAASCLAAGVGLLLAAAH
jgi:fluoride exporter